MFLLRELLREETRELVFSEFLVSVSEADDEMASRMLKEGLRHCEVVQLYYETLEPAELAVIDHTPTHEPAVAMFIEGTRQSKMEALCLYLTPLLYHPIVENWTKLLKGVAQ